MDRCDWFAFDHEDPDARLLTEAVRPNGMDPAHVLADKAAALLGTRLKPAPAHQHPAGLAVHYAVPIGLAILYASLKRRFPIVGKGKGSLFGAATFVLLDEVINPMIGLAAAPNRYPWQRHARELSAHIIFGLVTHTLTQALDSRQQKSNTTQNNA